MHLEDQIEKLILGPRLSRLALMDKNLFLRLPKLFSDLPKVTNFVTWLTGNVILIPL